MKIHEHQAKQLFYSYGIPVEKFILSKTSEESLNAYNTMPTERVVVKAQVLTGGRGKAGGIKLAKTKDEVKLYSEAILNMSIKNLPVRKVIISEAVNIKSEYYISFTIDRNAKSAVLILSDEGGMDIEEVAVKKPDKIYKFPIDPSIGIPDFLARKFALSILDDIYLVTQLGQIIQKLYQLFIDKDASLAEINPLVLTDENKLIAIDGKMMFDNNALYRQPDLQEFFEPTEEELIEANAKEKGFSYVHLEGNIGCMVNGAGLAMATMDMIKLYGGTPANFLDIGGSSNPQKVIDAMTLLLKDPQVRVVLINIFGGITRCDDVASGLIKAFDQLKTDIPVIVRLTGTNEQEGRKILENTRFKVAETMSEAVSMAVKSI
ncbi:ADP-forming succinate--CoA ligase subunit beta [Dysgonomonas sp. Marseille-P4361]|uniref:ADP-forming succinate--CoA ligase subunit beta n=1 Tax=Dysgonomonas sp. Marseille-P4361 TaxID=2161820 RepID=UPI000D558C80|nr:ADP-forming succinate--CoA ligase subunit beta [Dysgonomonas sp. Marseille-P4361]